MIYASFVKMLLSKNMRSVCIGKLRLKSIQR